MSLHACSRAICFADVSILRVPSVSCHHVHVIGPYTFQKFEGWQHPGLSPVPSEALKLLHRLAADPGIFGIMSKHRWTVGLLSEMPPEGKVGVSPMCILGVNINAGQEISLRLRTDDLKGFRRSLCPCICHNNRAFDQVHGTCILSCSFA